MGWKKPLEPTGDDSIQRCHLTSIVKLHTTDDILPHTRLNPRTRAVWEAPQAREQIYQLGRQLQKTQSPRFLIPAWTLTWIWHATQIWPVTQFLRVTSGGVLKLQPVNLQDPYITLPWQIWNNTRGRKYSLRIIPKLRSLWTPLM